MMQRFYFKTFFALFLCLATANPGAVAAAEVTTPKAVLELFTSQGCASCPPADKLLSTLSDRADVITLAYHVDYWDYAGWADTLGGSENSRRQRDYAASWGSSRIYTPQMIVNGAKDVVGSRQKDVNTAIGAAELPVPVTLTANKTMLMIDIPGNSEQTDGVVWLVTYLDKADVAIERGENRGKTMTYSHVVVGHQMLGMWEAGNGAHLKLPLSEVFRGKGNGAVVMVQQEQNRLPGRILGAASIVQ